MPLTRKAPFDNLDRFFEKFVAVGIDFGTTYTGVSWARSTDPKDINSITGWPSSDHRSKNEIQVPTLYDFTSHKWGHEITPDMKPIKWFKLLLLKKEDLTREAGGDSQQLKQTLDILDAIGRDITPVQLVGLYLKEVWDHTYTSLRSMIDIDNLPLRVAITVPAIWPDYAKSSMRQAAKLAGITDHRAIGETTLITVEEPEAAALASVFQRNSFFEIKRNDSFVVCDAGGGTIDVISYKVVCEQPFKLEECTPGRGKLDGAFLIDQAFFAYLQGKAKLKIKSLTASDYNGFILREWELATLQLQWVEFVLIEINRLDMVGFFNRSLTGIRHLVGDQCKQVRAVTGEDPKRILLVGGLGSSEYICNALNESFNNKVLRPSEGWSAVARGAALRLLQENIAAQRVRSPLRTKLLGVLPDVVSRRSRYHYGILAKTPIANLDRYPQDIVLTDPDGIKVTLRMNWYLHKGDKVDKETRIPISYYQHCRESQPLPPKCTLQTLYCEDSIAPKRKTGTLLPLCRIECEWDKPITEWKRIGPPSSGWRKHDDLEVTMGLQGEPKWMVRVGSKKQEHRFYIEYVS
ncbi:hypothetical protein LB507_010920 [Fusarium sp. FIESC RH6]|nr:hypothetical protein LB507_010920 [Fusarium sp. FIESC RH6]